MAEDGHGLPEPSASPSSAHAPSGDVEPVEPRRVPAALTKRVRLGVGLPALAIAWVGVGFGFAGNLVVGLPLLFIGSAMLFLLGLVQFRSARTLLQEKRTNGGTSER